MITEPDSVAVRAASVDASRVCVILNPAARSGATVEVRAEIPREFERRAIAWTRVDTTEPGHATQVARAAALAGAPVVVAVGGDGTVHEVANGLIQASSERTHHTALAVVPCGTGNDFATLIAGVASRAAAYDALAQRRIRSVDAGLVQWGDEQEYFVNGMGTGIDVEVVRQLRKTSRLPGAFIYLSAVVRALRVFRPVPLRLEGDDASVDSRAMMAAICNGPRVGGGFRLCPDARPDDGLLDACFVEELSGPQIPPTLLAVLRGTHGGRPRVRMLRAATFSLVAAPDHRLVMQLDGELRDAGDATTVRVSIMPGALRVVSGPATEG